MSEGRQRSEEPDSTRPRLGRTFARGAQAAVALLIVQSFLNSSTQAAIDGAESAPLTLGSLTPSLLGLVALFFLHALFAAAETALRSVSRSRMTALSEEGHRGATYVLRLMEHPASFLTAIQVLKTTLTLSIAVTAFPLVQFLLQSRQLSYAGPVTVVVIVVLLLLFGEIVPKVLASHHADRVALFSGGWIRFSTAIIYPLFRGIDRLSGIFVNRSGDKLKNRSPLEAEEEIKMMAAGGVETGEIEPEEQEMIRGVLTATDKVVREVMVPRIDLTAVDADSPVDELLDAILVQGHSRIPIYEETIDRIIGIVHARDLLKLLAVRNAPELTIRELPMRSPHYIPENKRLLDLLGDLRQTKNPIAIVVDEYGGTAGLVTIEDLLEEIVGEIMDESDVEEEPFQQVDENTVIFAARVPIDDVNEMLKVHLPEDEFDTIGGFVFGQVGRLPDIGQTVTYDGVTLTVEDADDRRIQRVRAQKIEPEEAEDLELV